MRSIPPGAQTGALVQPVHTCQNDLRMSTAQQTMAFKNEVVSDADIDRYNIPFQKGDGRWWTRDAENDYYLWGGLSGNQSFDTEKQGKFYLYADGELHLIIVSLAKDSEQREGDTFIRKWQHVLRIVPDPRDSQEERHLIGILKAALLVYQYDGQDDGFHKAVSVHIAF